MTKKANIRRIRVPIAIATFGRLSGAGVITLLVVTIENAVEVVGEGDTSGESVVKGRRVVDGHGDDK